MNIIAVCDGKSGHKSQLEGVLEQLNKNNSNNIFNIVSGSYFFAFLPSIFSNTSFFIPHKKKQEVKNVFKNINLSSNDNKLLIIAIGRRTLATSLYIKKIAQQKKIKPFLVYLMPPSKIIKAIDLIFIHNYKLKNTNLANNYIPILMPPHKINADVIKQYQVIFGKENKNYQINNDKNCNTAILIGGNAKDIVFSEESVADILQLIKKIHAKSKDNFIVVTSRRTPLKIEQYLYEQIKLLPNINIIFFGYNLGISQNTKITNPYLFALSFANKIVVTGESISMLAEASSLANNVEVIVFFSNNFYAKRYVKFHEMLYANNYALSLEDYLQNKTIKRQSINSTQDIAKTILQQFKK